MEKGDDYAWNFGGNKNSSKSEISLWIDNYLEIFSAFDPRPFSQKALSIDFLEELKRASVDKTGGSIDLEILAPKNKRNSRDEAVIKKRLREHFKKHHDIIGKEKRGILRQGWAFIIFGVLFMFIASYILFYYTQRNLVIEFVIVLFQPGGWFLFWEGLNLLIFEAKRINPDLVFYRKMAISKINFVSY